MSSAHETDLRAVQERTLDLYGAVTVLMLVGIAVLIVYAIRLGSLTSPGAERSFGFALALMLLMAAVIFHVADRTYRSWPLGRRFRPASPGPVTTEAWAQFLKVLIVVVAVAGIAYLLGGLLA